MRRAVALLAVTTFLPLTARLAGQTKSGHVFVLNYYQVVPGKGPAYNKALAEVAIPVFDEMVKRRVIVAYHFLAQSAGTGEYTHLAIFELENWAAFDGFLAKVNDASQAVLHKSYTDASADFPELRRFVRSEHYLPAGLQP